MGFEMWGLGVVGLGLGLEWVRVGLEWGWRCGCP